VCRRLRYNTSAEEGSVRIDPLVSARLRVRQLEPGDWAAVHAYASDPAVMAYIPEGTMSEQQARAFAAENAGEEARAFAVVLASSGELIGHMFFHPWFGPRTFEIGWVLHPRHHGHGYATEAARALLRYGFEELALHRVIATCQPENAPSWRVMEKLAMRREAHFRKCMHRGGTTWWDEYFYAVLEEEWLATYPAQRAGASPPAPEPAPRGS
jgi:ribosomal-protein-alanine N-acetyltransferase